MKQHMASYLKRGAAPFAIGVALLASPAFAQDDQPAPTSAAPAASETEIVVTGSRIPQPNLESVSPVTVVNSQDIKLQGITRVEDLLNSLPQVFAGQASTISNAATGAATVDLRGLGPTRTLVLVNGRRLLPGDPGSSAADLNAVPESLIKRVEVLTGGASATYGADAVAGVVNFIMDSDFTGIRVDGQYSLYQHNNRNTLLPPLLDARTKAGFSGFGYPSGSVADGGAVTASVTMGTGFDDGRGHITAYATYRKVNAVTQNNRDYSACTIQNASATALQCGGSSTSAPGNALLFEPGGTSSTFYQIGPNRTLIPGRTRYNFAPTNYFQRPDERYSAGFFAHYDINDSIKPYMEFMFMDDRTVAQIAPSGDFGNTLTINCDNPLLSTQQRNVVCNSNNLITGFLGNFPLTPVTNSNHAAPPVTFIDPNTGATYNRGYFQLLRRNIEGGPRRDDRQHTEYRGVIGTKGQIAPGWSYDAYYQYGRTVYSETYQGDFSASRLANALDVIDDPRVAGIQPICRSALSGNAACVPYDVFGGTGAITPAAINYLSVAGFQRGVVSEQVANASVTGDTGLKTPWADNGLAVNFGAEYRKEKLEFTVDQEFATGDLTGQGGATLPTSGSYNVKEFFAEAQFPLVHDGFVYDLSLQGGYRYSSYNVSNGRGYNTDTYKFGAEFAPIRDIRLRASYNRAVRAPNLQELFSPRQVALDGSTDPCTGHTITASAADAGCRAQGLSVGQNVVANPAGQYNGLIGGTSTLNPEVATTKTFGAVFQPSFLPKFALSVDWFDIKVNGAVQGFGADAILASCTTTVNPLACSLIHRNPVNGSLWLTPDGYVEDVKQNIGSIKTRGIDVNASYATELGSAGSLSLSLVGTYLDKFVTDNGLTPAYDCAGLYGVTCSGLTTTPTAPSPKWRHKARATFTLPQGIGFSLQWRYFGPVAVDYTSSNPSLNGAYFNFGSHLKAQNYFDLAGTFKIGGHYAFRLGVNNIFDKEPPLVTSGDAAANSNTCPTGPCNGNTYPAVYDALGRYIFAGVTLDF